jgi:Putative beta barrel porin-7 (BBP7)
MRNGLIVSCLTLLAGAGASFAQEPLSPIPAVDAGGVPDWVHGDNGTPSFGEPAGDKDCEPRFWGGVDYLLWWIKDAPLPPKLVLTGDPTTNNPGALNAGGFPILAGSQVDFGALSGVQATIGAWLDGDHQLGIEVGGFILPQQVKAIRAASNGNGNPVLGFRYFDPPVNGVAAEDVFQASVPPGNPFGVGPFSGSLAVVSDTRFWGTEANAVLGMVRSGGLCLQALGGFRYADLSESLSLQLQSTAIDNGMVNFLGNAFGAPSSIATVDSFQTRNQFYGGQLGLRGEYCLGNLFVEATGKIALGSTHESINILGTSTLFPNPGPLVTVPSGQFAEPSNIGRRTHNEFAVMPEVEIKVGYQVTSWLRATVGYDFLYLSQVVRPGNQVDLIVDDRTNAVNPAFVPGTNGTTFPRPVFEQTSFWAQGLTFGLEFRY